MRGGGIGGGGAGGGARGLSAGGGVAVVVSAQRKPIDGEILSGTYGTGGLSADFMSSASSGSPQPTRTQPGSAAPTGPTARLGTARASSSRAGRSKVVQVMPPSVVSAARPPSMTDTAKRPPKITPPVSPGGSCRTSPAF